MITVGIAPAWRFKEETDHGSRRLRNVERARVVHGAADRRPGRLKEAALALALIVLIAPAAFAQTYTVEIRPTLNDLDVGIEQVAKSSMLVLRLTNNTDQRVRCRLRYDAPPQTTFRSSLNVDPGRTAQSVFRAQRKWFAVVVEVNCEARP
ncbi:MAG: hypothetical protein IPJ97_09085 [Proteobacteria bacterium]|nr:hypothetical protein [Pseudomonadota bacterium]